MNKMLFALVGIATCAGLVFADSAADVTAAASDPGKIAGIVKNLGNGSVSSFASDVMNAVAKMPVSPARKIRQMVGVSEGFLGTTSPDKSQDIVEALVASVAPYKFQPEWIKLFKPSVDAFYEKVGDEDYRKIVAGVLAKVDSDKNVADKDKYVVTSFALLLLARGENAEEKDNWLTFITIPAACDKQVRAVMPDVFRGNYDALLGGEKLNFVKPVNLNDVTREGQENLDDNSNVTRVGRPVPVTYRVRTKGHGKKKHHKDDPAPIPDPYSGQF